MDITSFLAQVIGLYLLVMGAGVLLHPDRVAKALAEGAKSYLFPYFDGALALLVGLVIVLLHNVWTDLTSVIISLVGWLAVIEGLTMTLMSQNAIADLLKSFKTRNWCYGIGVVALVVGAYLTYVGFGLGV